MKIWSCFSANDINNDNELDINEIKTLFWLFDGAKPSIAKIDRETKIMDADGSGTVDRLEWLKYLCSGGSDGSGKDYYDFRLREMFDRADKKKLGSLQFKELLEFLKLDCRKFTENFEEHEKENLEPAFLQFAERCWFTQKGKAASSSDQLALIEFKNFRKDCAEHIDYMQEKINYYILDKK